MAKATGMLSAKQINILTGKALVGKMSRSDQVAICNHVTAMEAVLDKCDLDDFFGTEGWRHFFGQPEREV